MSVLVIGVSHRSAPMTVLEAVTLPEARAAELARQVSSAENVSAAVVLATCNRVEVYADALTFHGAVADIGAALAAVTGLPRGVLNEHLYVHYEDRAIAHAFSVACGLDSMAVGETQILGQLRDALTRAQRDGHAGPLLNALFQQALRVGKRAHAETGLDRVSASLLDTGLAEVTAALGPLAGLRTLVLGAGTMSGLTMATLSRAGVGSLTVASRTASSAARLAELYPARVAPMAELATELAEADLVISCTGAVGHVVGLPAARAASAARSVGRPGGQPGRGASDGPGQAYLDLALPRDVDPLVGQLPGVLLVSLADLAERLDRQRTSHRELAEVRDLVTAQVAAFLVQRRSQEVGPTVAALRSQAARVVAAELERLDARMPELSEVARAELRRTVHRVVEKLLHTPTVRVKELAGLGQGGDYAHALRELFDLDPYDVAAVSAPPDQGLP